MIHEASLHRRGAEIQHQKLLRLLNNRLRMQRDIARHPDILDQSVNAPIFLCDLVEPVIKQVFPDATLVMTHRHPRETMASTCSLLDAYFKPHTDASVDYQSLVAGLEQQMQLHMDNRARYPELNILDINFRELITSVETVIEKIYSHAGMTLTEASRNRMMAWDSNNPRHKAGAHKYSLSDFGFTEKAIDQVYTDYIDFMEKL